MQHSHSKSSAARLSLHSPCNANLLGWPAVLDAATWVALGRMGLPNEQANKHGVAREPEKLVYKNASTHHARMIELYRTSGNLLSSFGSMISRAYIYLVFSLPSYRIFASPNLILDRKQVLISVLSVHNVFRFCYR